jgi:hypothetical protein
VYALSLVVKLLASLLIAAAYFLLYDKAGFGWQFKVLSLLPAAGAVASYVVRNRAFSGADNYIPTTSPEVIERARLLSVTADLLSLLGLLIPLLVLVFVSWPKLGGRT